MGKITGLTGERRKQYIRNTVIWVSSTLFGVFLFLVYMAPYTFHLVPNSTLHKAVGITMLVALVVSGGFYQSLSFRGQTYNQLDIKERDAHGKTTNRVWRFLNWSPWK